MYTTCGSDFAKVHIFCKLYSFTATEVLEALKITNLIQQQLK